MAKRKSNANISPWGRVVGLLVGCAVTLVGVIAQLDPHVILFRAATSAFAVGTTVAIGLSVVRTTDTRSRTGRLKHR